MYRKISNQTMLIKVTHILTCCARSRQQLDQLIKHPLASLSMAINWNTNLWLLDFQLKFRFYVLGRLSGVGHKLLRDWYETVLFNPFTAQACKISGLKNPHIHACKWYIWSPLNINVLSVLCTLSEILSRAHAKRFHINFCTFIGRFPSDGAASLAVKGLIKAHQ